MRACSLMSPYARKSVLQETSQASMLPSPCNPHCARLAHTFSKFLLAFLLPLNNFLIALIHAIIVHEILLRRLRLFWFLHNACLLSMLCYEHLKGLILSTPTWCTTPHACLGHMKSVLHSGMQPAPMAHLIYCMCKSCRVLSVCLPA